MSKSRSLTIFAEIDHAARPPTAGLTLRPLFLFIFGSSTGGTPLTQSAATSGIDLPMKILVWQDASGVTQVSYNDPHWLAERHQLGDDARASGTAMSALLRAVVEAGAA